MQPPSQTNTHWLHTHWSRLGKRLVLLSLALLVPATLLVLYLAYSFGLGYGLQNALINAVVGLELLLFFGGCALLFFAWLQKNKP